MKKIKILIFITLLFSSFLNVSAHVVNFKDLIEIKSDLKIENNKIFFKDVLSIPLIAGSRTQEEIVAFSQGYYKDNFIIKNKNNNCDVKVEKVSTDWKNTTTQGFFTCKKDISSINELDITNSLLTDYPHNSRNIYLDIKNNSEEKNIILTDKKQEFIWTESKNSSSQKDENYLIIIEKFIKLWITHILSWTDHILFLIALILTSVRFKNIIFLATGFTISHSITLVLTWLWLVTISPHIVEPLIALSIIFMAVWDLKYFSAKKLKKINKINKRILITMFFGLFHWLGFADALSWDNIIPKDYTATALFSFNVWIELWQILIIILVFPLILFLRKNYEKFWQRTLQILSILVIFISTYWFFDRVI